jgi:hypothetical protein
MAALLVAAVGCGSEESSDSNNTPPDNTQDENDEDEDDESDDDDDSDDDNDSDVESKDVIEPDDTSQSDDQVSEEEARVSVELTNRTQEFQMAHNGESEDFEEVPVTICSVQIGPSQSEDDDDLHSDASAPDTSIPDAGAAMETMMLPPDGAGPPGGGLPGPDTSSNREDTEGTDSENGRGNGGGSPLDGQCGVGSSSGWTTLVDTEQTYDLLELQGDVTEALGGNTIPAGDYNQLRLILSDAEVVVDGQTNDLFVPSGTQTGFKLNHDFDVPAGAECNMVLDFNAEESIKKTGRGYLLTPVLNVESFSCEDSSGGSGGAADANTVDATRVDTSDDDTSRGVATDTSGDDNAEDTSDDDRSPGVAIDTSGDDNAEDTSGGNARDTAP